jgi:methylmalonyl-CoA/ethylmalonyl-CoA epimerase
MIEHCQLDHVAVAAEEKEVLWRRYAGDLSGRWAQGGIDPGFFWSQFEYANGMRVEILEPHDVADNDFLRRFLDRNGPGAHHLTFKVPDIEDAIDAATAAGYPPVGVNLAHEGWKEAFLHPKNVPGIVVQLAYSPERDDEWSVPTPADLPPPRAQEPARLVRVVHAVADLDDGVRLWVDLLGGNQIGAGGGAGVTWIDLAWAGAGRLRLLAPASPGGPLAKWLGDRRGRLHHLAFVVADPGAIDGARAWQGGVVEVPAVENSGVRLVLSDDEAQLLA